MRKAILIFLILFAFNLPQVLSAKDLGEHGAVYSIQERDALEEVRERASQVNWSDYINKGMIKRYDPSSKLSPLPKAKKSRTFGVDLTYTLDFDIADGKGGVLYPKGYTFNPLGYISYPFTLVFIDAGDKEQVRWLKESEYYKSIYARVLLTGGDYNKTGGDLKIPVFYADQKIIDKLQVQRVPSVVRQNGLLMEVTEIDIASENKKNND